MGATIIQEPLNSSWSPSVVLACCPAMELSVLDIVVSHARAYHATAPTTFWMFLIPSLLKWLFHGAKPLISGQNDVFLPGCS